MNACWHLLLLPASIFLYPFWKGGQRVSQQVFSGL
jgi:hypothetical protein